MTQFFNLLIPDVKETTDTLSVFAAYDRKLIAKLASADKAAVDIALNNAHTLFEDRSLRLKTEKRLDILKKTAELMSDQAESLALEAAREGGKPLIDSRIEVARAIEGMHVCIETLRTTAGLEIPMGLNAATVGKLAFTHFEPIGVVVAVSAFNHPLNLIVHQVAPAVAVGCPIIVKPASDTPLSCYRFVNLLYEAGLPPSWCQCLVTKDDTVTTQLVTSPKVSFFSFIGSAKVGWMLRSKLAPGTRCALEHGGVAPVIVTEDADLDDAIPKLIKGGFYHAGQVCVSVQRIFVHETIAEMLTERLVAAAEKLLIGDPTLGTTDVGPLIRPGEVDRLEAWVNEAKSLGSQIRFGGKKLSETTFQPTILYAPPDQSKVSQQEIFGPVINGYPYREMNEAIQRANALPFAFQAGIFTKNINWAMQAYRQLNASAVMINEHTAFRADWMPFAGLGESGLGVGGIPHTFKDMQIEKMIVITSHAI